MTANELRRKYLDFFGHKGHAVIPSASLLPENDPTVLFTTAGMHPLVPFLMGEKHPAGSRLVNYQRCLRTGDIDLVGDDTHLTFFEMLGNWSLGDYFKKEAIEWSWEFLTGKKWLGLDPERIYVTCFAGDNDAPKDDESARIWQSVGVPDMRIAFLGKDDNWWGPAGPTGPCGPDTEMFYQVNTIEDERPSGVDWPKGKYIEVWNDVFMEYSKTSDGRFEPLKQKNVDTGMGVERTLAVLNGLSSVYETELFAPVLSRLQNSAPSYNETSARILADHLKSAVFLVADGILPSNKDQGYVLRRLIRKSVREANRIALPVAERDTLISLILDLYRGAYPHLADREQSIRTEIAHEAGKFLKTIAKGLKLLTKDIEKINAEPQLAGQYAFDLHQTYGFPPELTFDILTKESGVSLEHYMFDALYQDYQKKHQELSRKGAEQKFAGGLADHSERVVRMHTATHLLHQALRDVLGSHVLQKGSNITSERLRFDFTQPQKVTSDELQKVEDRVNEKVREALTVTKKIIPLEEARQLGAIGLFGEKYGDTVSVYLIGDYSKEFCGGPHVQNTKDVGRFTILKEEAVSSGVRRIKAVVE
ncbi:MAG: alanine--tRNA ligase [Candidatus Kerfeldbacteria bacterium]|nr:alanine--tRNA ligase [Candidatus Kerfeldbacteria bacterium]